MRVSWPVRLIFLSGHNFLLHLLGHGQSTVHQFFDGGKQGKLPRGRRFNRNPEIMRLIVGAFKDVIDAGITISRSAGYSSRKHYSRQISAPSHRPRNRISPDHTSMMEHSTAYSSMAFSVWRAASGVALLTSPSVVFIIPTVRYTMDSLYADKHRHVGQFFAHQPKVLNDGLAKPHAGGRISNTTTI